MEMMKMINTIFFSFMSPLYTGGKYGRIMRTWIKVLIVFEVSLLATTTGLQLQIQDKYVAMDNGILQVTLSKPEGYVTRIRYQEVDNLLENSLKENNRGYWDMEWSEARRTTHNTIGNLDKISGTTFKVIEQTEEKLEISFTRTWDKSSWTVPLNIDKRFIMLRDSSGYYTYAIFERLQGWPSTKIENIRMVLKLNKNKFNYMAISDDKQRYMPSVEDRTPPRGQPLDYPEAVKLVNPVEPELKGEVDDKYDYALEQEDIKVHGWVSNDSGIGLWQITSSFEYRASGPVKQSLTSHVGPITIAIFHSVHYAGTDLIIKFEDGEPWKKVLGPVFVYLNSFSNDVRNPRQLWRNAKKQMEIESEGWPYNFLASEDFPPSDQRGSVSGRLLVRDRFVSEKDMPAKGAYVGLATPGEAGSWQYESKGYQFWTKTDEDGRFVITNVRTGTYNLYAFISGFIGDYIYDKDIQITKGIQTKLDDSAYEPLRNESTLWEIGIPNRKAGEYFIPDPNPEYINKLFVNSSNDRYRQYGLWERYVELYPRHDLIFNVGVDDYRKDWFFAQVTRNKVDVPGYQGTTWQIKFSLDNVDQKGIYILRFALASAHLANLEVRVNSDLVKPPLFRTGLIGRDNAIARHGIHGLYRLYSVNVPAAQLYKGKNTVFLTQPLCVNQFQGIMYDYIRLEGPSK